MLRKSISFLLLLMLSQATIATPQCESAVLQTAVEKYFAFEINQDWHSLYNYRTSQFKAQIPEADYSEQLGAFVNEIWLARFTWIGVEQDNDQCLVKVELSEGFLPGRERRFQRLGPNGNAFKQKVDMRWAENNGSWVFVESTRVFQPFNSNE